jgi:hypothetical protein
VFQHLDARGRRGSKATSAPPRTTRGEGKAAPSTETLSSVLSDIPARRIVGRMRTERLDMRVRPEWLAKVDDWRRRQPTIPTRSEAVRILVEQALDGSDERPASAEPSARHPPRPDAG